MRQLFGIIAYKLALHVIWSKTGDVCGAFSFENNELLQSWVVCQLQLKVSPFFRSNYLLLYPKLLYVHLKSMNSMWKKS